MRYETLQKLPPNTSVTDGVIVICAAEARLRMEADHPFRLGDCDLSVDLTYKARRQYARRWKKL